MTVPVVPRPLNLGRVSVKGSIGRDENEWVFALVRLIVILTRTSSGQLEAQKGIILFSFLVVVWCFACPAGGVNPLPHLDVEGP